MTASNASTNSTTNKKRSVITFEKARLILVDKTSSYVELSSPDDFATRVNTVLGRLENNSILVVVFQVRLGREI